MTRKKRKPTRKTAILTVRVSYPAFLSAAQLRKEVKTLINHGSNFSDRYVMPDGEWKWIDTGDIRAAAVHPGPKEGT